MDYRGTTILIMFEHCETRKCINVTIVNDDILESIYEHFSASLRRTANLDPRITIDPESTRVAVRDDDL